MDKERLLSVLADLQDGTKDAGYCHDELETLIALVTNAEDGDIAAAWGDIHMDDGKTE